MNRGCRGLVAALFVCGALSIVGAQPQWQDVVRNLRHPKASVRLEAVERLGTAGYLAAIEPVAPLINDADDSVQSAALDAELSFFLVDRVSGGGGHVLSIGGSRSRAQQAFDAGPLVRSATPAPAVLIDALIAAMRDENSRVRFDAVHVLGVVAEPPITATAIAGIVDGLDHYDPVIRMATARVIGRLAMKEAGSKLVDAMADSHPTVRELAVEAVGLVREARALPMLRDQLGRTRDSSDALLLAIARIAAPEDAGLLRTRLADRSASVRRAAVEGLGRMGDRESLAGIDSLFKNDRSNEVRLAAAYALDRLGQTQSHVIASMLVLEECREQARSYLFELGRAAVPGVRAALEVATDSRHRADLVQVLGYVGSREDLPLAEQWLADRDQRVVRAATSAALRLRAKT